MSVLTTNRNPGKPKALFEFTHGIDVDSKLASQEVRVQKAWVRALVRAGVLTSAEENAACGTLDEALALMQSGKFDWRIEDEDIHMNLERFVSEKHGVLGKKIHLGRSRNDLIATTLRLFVQDRSEEISALLRELVAAISKKAEATAHVIIPGMTHLQHGQPIRFGHVLSAHGWALSRDQKRVTAHSALDRLPLGSAALAGTALEIDLASIAKELGFKEVSVNSYDSVGNRDFMVEALDGISLTGVHLSRFAEDLVFWASGPVGLVKLPSAWSTGSSIMPNKRNPDVPELIRAKSSHLIAASANAHTLLKGLPTSYMSDLHELKNVFIRSADQLSACLNIFSHFISEMQIDERAATSLTQKGHILATEVADELAARGVPFRDAYAQVAAMVESAEAQGLQIHELKEAQWKPLAPQLNNAFMSSLSVETAVERRNQPGGTSLAQVQAGIRKLKQEI